MKLTEDPVIEEARRAGVELDLLDTNLTLPVAERWRQHDAALGFALKLEAARIARDERLQQAARAAD